MIAEAQLVAWAALVLVVPGLVVRTKAWWAGRRGPPVLQLGWELRRLLHKRPVVSAVATPVFEAAPWVGLAAALAGVVVVPQLGADAPLPFRGDLVWLAYTAGLGRVARVAAALDTGSPFEGMGAARTAGFAVLTEPALFLLLGAGVLVGGEPTVSGALRFVVDDPASGLVWASMAAALVVVSLVESSRMPVDDPTTHLELTMVHEVTILDHSGPALAALQLTSAVELTVGLSLLVALLLPTGLGPAAGALAAVAGVLGAAVALGTLESLVARLRMRAVPAFVGFGAAAAAAALVSTLWVPR